MPPEITKPAAVDYKAHVSKKFRHKTNGLLFTVADHTPDFDFGARRGGRKPAFTIVREDTDTVSTVMANAFLADHDPV